jgi:probable rRNA maturation factor
MTGFVAAIEVTAPCGAWERCCPDPERLVQAAARLALEKGADDAAILRSAGGELTVVLADDAEQRRLNRQWRGIDQPTNVLAFPGWDPGAPLPGDAPLLLGDVVLAFETVMREAAEQHKTVADHLSHLVVHGVLHLLGYDHATEPEAAAMESIEKSVLASLGVADPYRGTM